MVPKEKEKPEEKEKAASPAAVERTSEIPEKMGGPQAAASRSEASTKVSRSTPEIARAVGRMSSGGGDDLGTTDRARVVGSMQHNVGNARVGRMFGGVQTKTEVSSPEDDSEKEADEISDKVMRMSDREAQNQPPGGAPPRDKRDGAGGEPLSKSDRDFMEPRFGRSFDKVRLHTGAEAQRQAAGFGAKAFTRGSDISFGEGAGPSDKKLLAHELTHVAQQENGGSSEAVMRAPGPLSAAEEASARRFTANHYDERSVRIIQIITGTRVDGRFGDISAQAVATFQGGLGLAVDGKVGVNTLNQMVANRVAAGSEQHAIQLVVDFHDLNVTSDTLSIHFDASLAAAGATAFGPGNLRVITLGPTAFTSEPTLLATINAQLATPAPALPPIGPRPALLTRAQELSAIGFNRRHFSDRRSALAIQGHVGANPDAVFGPDTVQRIADAQRIAGLVIDGKVGEVTLELFVTQLIAAGQQDAAIRLIVDFFNFSEANLLDIFFDPTVAANASTDFLPNEPVRVRVGPSGLAQPFAGIVHTLQHELEHVRRLREGIVSRFTHEFLGEAVEILSEGTPEEALETLAPGAPGFVGGFADDAGRALANWNLMPAADQRQFRLRFIAVRRRVRARVAAGTPAQQALHAPLVAGYNAVVVPAP